MKTHFQHLRVLFLAAVTAFAVQSGWAATLKIGVVPGAYADSVKAAAKEAKKRGIDVQVIEFTDWTTPNVALNSGDLDANYFQHQPFLDNSIAKQGYKLKSVGTGILSNFGLYSLKHKTLAEVPIGGKVGIANDPVNQGRGLLLLQKAGLLQLKPGVGYLGSIKDITANPKKLSFVEVEGPQLVRITGDVDIALGYPHFIVASKAFDASSGLAYTGVEDLQFAIRFVAREDKAENPDLKKFIEIYQTAPEVRAVIHTDFNNDSRLYVLAWLNDPAAK
jgi:D-methionine transport system substrate-binding protein